MGQCIGKCCRSNRVQPDSRSDLTINLADKRSEETQGQAWIEPDNDDVSTTGLSSNRVQKEDESDDVGKGNISENSTLIDHEQADGTTFHRVSDDSSQWQHVQPQDETDGEHEQMERETSSQDQSEPIAVVALTQHDHNQHVRDLVSQRDQCDILASIPAGRVLIKLPKNFDTFVRKIIVPNFSQQRRCDQNQFAVLLFVTEKDFRDINQMKFHPHDSPITNNKRLSMPDNEDDYHNYIVARPQNDKYHAENVIFDNLDRLWKGFMSRSNKIPPKCFILYSFNFPCTKCTNLIIRSFNKPPYKSVSVIVAATAYWDRESHEVRSQNVAKMKGEQFCVSEHRPIKLPEHKISYRDSYYDSYSDEYY